MITSCRTPCYNPSRHDKTIPPRKLSDLEFAKLQELLRIYLTKPQNISQMQNDTFKDIKLQLQPLKALMRKQTASSTTKRNRMSDHDTEAKILPDKEDIEPQQYNWQPFGYISQPLRHPWDTQTVIWICEYKCKQRSHLKRHLTDIDDIDIGWFSGDIRPPSCLRRLSLKKKGLNLYKKHSTKQQDAAHGFLATYASTNANIVAI